MVHEHLCKLLYMKFMNPISCDKQVVEKHRSKMAKKKLTENNCHDWNLSEVRCEINYACS